MEAHRKRAEIYKTVRCVETHVECLELVRGLVIVMPENVSLCLAFNRMLLPQHINAARPPRPLVVHRCSLADGNAQVLACCMTLQLSLCADCPSQFDPTDEEVRGKLQRIQQASLGRIWSTETVFLFLLLGP